MNILFTTSSAPPKSPFYTDEKRPPLGVGFLISLARKKGHEVYFIDNYLKSYDYIAEGYLKKNRIEIVGIHSNTICSRDTIQQINKLENLRKTGKWKGKIVVGGPHTSVALETIPKFVDYIVQGEGEKAFLDILSGRAEERVIRGERVKDLDSLLFQPWDIFTKLPYDYSCRWIEKVPLVFTMNTSRGCPFNCAFCSVCSIWGKKYTFQSADRIISEIEFLIKGYGAKGIYFREDNFTLKKKRTRDFCEKLIRKNLGIVWACETRVDNLDENLIELMSRAGCRAFYLGIESGSQKVLDKLNKNITVKQIESVINWCKKYNINTYCSLIVGTGHDDYGDYKKTKKLMRKLKPDKYSFNVYVGIPGSPLYKEILDKKLYEYKDDIGLLYMPGYDIKEKYFNGKNSSDFLDYKFKERTNFDKKLKRNMWKMYLRRYKAILLTVIKKVFNKNKNS